MCLFFSSKRADHNQSTNQQTSELIKQAKKLRNTKANKKNKTHTKKKNQETAPIGVSEVREASGGKLASIQLISVDSTERQLLKAVHISGSRCRYWKLLSVVLNIVARSRNCHMKWKLLSVVLTI